MSQQAEERKLNWKHLEIKKCHEIYWQKGFKAFWEQMSAEIGGSKRTQWLRLSYQLDSQPWKQKKWRCLKYKIKKMCEYKSSNWWASIQRYLMPQWLNPVAEYKCWHLQKTHSEYKTWTFLATGWESGLYFPNEEHTTKWPTLKTQFYKCIQEYPTFQRLL